MGRQPCCDKVGLKRGPWTAEEDKKLINFILTNGQCCWRSLPKLAGLLRCGKSCRLRWINYLRPDLKRGLLSESEEKLVIDLHAQLGNRWSKIASQLPGRTDNEIKNHWNTHIKKKLKKMGIDPVTHQPIITTTTPSSDPPKEQEQALPSSPPTTGKEDNEESFCIDEVPFIDPSEIPVQVQPACSSSASSSSPSSSSSGSILQDLRLDWPVTENLAGVMSFLEDDFKWEDFLINVDDIDSNLIVAADPLGQEAYQYHDWAHWTLP
ncbi:hypothetical protein SAY87_000221 [Trapa incisa]|uniref:Uncharacterized protein n=1 Tax=Trapa incisa TaxID=236973 RepID=A0AAN7GBD4_9MYRT|nr:hypothetical protein SAY87_000221 [Trapa incisa]